MMFLHPRSMWGIAYINAIPGSRSLGIGSKISSQPQTLQKPSSALDITRAVAKRSRGRVDSSKKCLKSGRCLIQKKCPKIFKQTTLSEAGEGGGDGANNERETGSNGRDVGRVQEGK